MKGKSQLLFLGGWVFHLLTFIVEWKKKSERNAAIHWERKHCNIVSTMIKKIYIKTCSVVEQQVVHCQDDNLFGFCFFVCNLYFIYTLLQPFYDALPAI